jgi:hypothetical protein
VSHDEEEHGPKDIAKGKGALPVAHVGRIGNGERMRVSISAARGCATPERAQYAIPGCRAPPSRLDRYLQLARHQPWPRDAESGKLLQRAADPPGTGIARAAARELAPLAA